MPRARVGVVLLPYSVSFDRVLAAARKAEELGFSSAWVPDHLQRGPLEILECWTTLSALAVSTKRIRVGSLATCNAFRNPALLSKMVATVSQISRGRVDLGIGAGYDSVEHESYGYGFPGLKDRVSALSESLQILTGLWAGSEHNFKGRHYLLEGAISLPRPLGKPRVWVAGRSDLVLEAAAHGGAYGVNVLPYSGTGERRRISSMDDLALLARRIASFGGLGISLYGGDGGCVLAPTKAGLSRRTARAARYNGCSTSAMQGRLANLSAIHGTVDECERRVRELEALGFEEFMLIFPGWQVGDYSNMEEFARAFLG